MNGVIHDFILISSVLVSDNSERVHSLAVKLFRDSWN